MRFIGFLFIINGFFAQPMASRDTLKARKIITHSAIASSAVGSLATLQGVWYLPYQQDGFHWFNDASNWMQMDKFGHGFSAYTISKSVSAAHRWASGKNQLWVGPTYAFSYLLSIEVMDGFSSGWGFSMPDVLANGLGCGLFLAQEQFWHQQIIQPKFSFRTSPYAPLRPDILGKTFSEQLLKDYNGQTYWFSVPLRSFLKLPKNLGFLCLSFGYGCDAKIAGDQDVYAGFNARRQVYLSLDIDLSAVAKRHPKLNKWLSQINYIKFPFPSLEFSSSKTRFHWLGF
jgi:hypothetical protein